MELEMEKYSLAVVSPHAEMPNSIGILLYTLEVTAKNIQEAVSKVRGWESGSNHIVLQKDAYFHNVHQYLNQLEQEELAA